MKLNSSEHYAAAQAISQELRSMQLASHNTPSSYFESASRNIDRPSHPDSLEANIDGMVNAALEGIEGGFVSTANKDRLRAALRTKFGNAGSPQVRAACEVLARVIGGDAESYYRTWNSFQPNGSEH